MLLARDNCVVNQGLLIFRFYLTKFCIKSFLSAEVSVSILVEDLKIFLVERLFKDCPKSVLTGVIKEELSENEGLNQSVLTYFYVFCDIF